MCHTLLSYCFTYSFFSFTTVRDTCDSKVDLVQKQFFIFNNYLFQLNFFNFWCHTCHTFRLYCCESTTYIISRGVTHGVTQCHARCHAPRITVHGGRIMDIKQWVEFLRPLKDGAVTEFYIRMASQALPPHKTRVCLAARYVLQQRGYIVPWIDQPMEHRS